jgi:hypothetical protein
MLITVDISVSDLPHPFSVIGSSDFQGSIILSQKSLLY